MQRAFYQVDVFASEPFGGNPVAVVVESDDLSAEGMQRIARWTNLSETTFLLPPTDPTAHYRVRIFTAAEELPFAGHPTLGSCHAWLQSGGQVAGEVVQECAAGLVRVRRGQQLAFAAPPLVRSGPVDDQDLRAVVSALRISSSDVLDAAWVDNGPGWVAVRMTDADAVLAVNPTDLAGYFIGVVGPGPDALEVRAFFSVNGATVEDPVTGSLNASVAPWLVDSGVLEFPYIARQGTAIGRSGRVYLSRDDQGTVWVGGRTTTRIAGVIEA